MRKVIYRNHREYERPPKEQDHEILRNWLQGKAGNENLRAWLSTLAV